MADRQKKGPHKLKNAGNRAAKIAAYYLYRYPVNKLRRIIRNNGISAAQSWAAKHNAQAVLEKLL